MEEAITFHNKAGKRLFGMVHLPDKIPEGKNKKVGINLLNPGIKYRVAPNRLNVKLARRLCENGFHVLRFDPEGIGDSEGEITENPLVRDIWEKIQKGLFIEDTIEANDFFYHHYNLEKLIMVGSCGGAITALLTGAQDSKVDALTLIDVPVNLRTAKTTFVDMAVKSGGKADFYFSEYLKRGFSLESWIRFVTLKTNFKALIKVLTIRLEKAFQPFLHRDDTSEEFEKLCNDNNLNRLFFESFEAFMGRKKTILFMLAGNDPGFEVFQHYFMEMYLGKASYQKERTELYEIFVIENANHVYSLKEWQDTLMNKIMTWVKGVSTTMDS